MTRLKKPGAGEIGLYEPPRKPAGPGSRRY
jgi:hypothetical protein